MGSLLTLTSSPYDYLSISKTQGILNNRPINTMMYPLLLYKMIELYSFTLHGRTLSFYTFSFVQFATMF